MCIKNINAQNTHNNSKKIDQSLSSFKWDIHSSRSLFFWKLHFYVKIMLKWELVSVANSLLARLWTIIISALRYRRKDDG
jgi:hypothetical protein